MSATTAGLSRLDIALQNACPTVMVPRFSDFVPLDHDGHRFLSASDGLYLEMNRPWIYLVLPATSESLIPLPYGSVVPHVEFAFEDDLVAHITQFIADARAVCPMEAASWMTYDADSGELHYEAVEVIAAGVARIQYHRPVKTGRIMAIDIHSHGDGKAFFSRTDNVDAEDDVKLEIVVGHVDTERPSIACRLTVFGMSVDYREWLAALLYAHGIETRRNKERA